MEKSLEIICLGTNSLSAISLSPEQLLSSVVNPGELLLLLGREKLLHNLTWVCLPKCFLGS